MTTAVVVSIIATLAVAFLRTRRRKLSPALRREYAEVAEWAERETTLITNAYARLGQDAERANRSACRTSEAPAPYSQRAATSCRAEPVHWKRSRSMSLRVF